MLADTCTSAELTRLGVCMVSAWYPQPHPGQDGRVAADVSWVGRDGRGDLADSSPADGDGSMPFVEDAFGTIMQILAFKVRAKRSSFQVKTAKSARAAPFLQRSLPSQRLLAFPGVLAGFYARVC